jgi:ankyrin repeat protein
MRLVCSLLRSSAGACALIASSAAVAQSSPESLPPVPPREVGPATLRNQPREHETIADQHLSVEPKVLDFGDVHRGDVFRKTITLTNISQRPVTIVRAAANCGCTVPSFPTEPIEPGQSVEVTIEFTPKAIGNATSLVRFFLSDQLGDVQASVIAKVLSPITITPELYRVDAAEDVQVVLESTDGEPFRIMGVDPEIIEGIDDVARARHELTLSAEKIRLYQNRNTAVRFYVDHKRIDTVMLKSNKFETSDQMKRLMAWARGQGALEDLATLVDEGVDLFETDNNDRTALMYAAQSGAVERAMTLMEFQADVAARDRNGSTALIDAAKSQSSNAEMVQLLLDAGSDLTMRDKFGKTALHWCARSGDAERLALLIEAGADVNTFEPTNRETALLAAVKSRSLEKVRLLVEAGANVAMRDFKGRSPYDQAKILAAAMPGQAKADLEAVAAYLKEQMELAAGG